MALLFPVSSMSFHRLILANGTDGSYFSGGDQDELFPVLNWKWAFIRANSLVQTNVQCLFDLQLSTVFDE